ncbi:MAG: Crp/Fnr family transcriptional regulator [Ruminococcaceae bacterium]|nr:Crp/Fnr family transcriptional regulator [Oscillospiraceae bacterium]
MQKYFKVLRDCPLFVDINDGDIIGMLSCLGADLKLYTKGETIVAEGDAAKAVGVLLSGEAQIEQVDYYGNRSITMHIAPSDLFGESFALSKVLHMPVSIVAAKDCEVMFFDRMCVSKTCAKACVHHQQIIFNLMNIMADKNLAFHQKLEIVSKRTTREKLIAYLAIFAKQIGKRTFDIPFDRQELADYLAVDRSGLSAEISKLCREGVIECRKNRFTLL